MSFRSTVRSMIGYIKKLFPPKTGMWKKQLLQDAGYFKGVKSTCYLARLYEVSYVEGVERNKK